MAEGTESSREHRNERAATPMRFWASRARRRLRRSARRHWRQVRFHSMGNDPSLRLQELREAYETLTDPTRRAAFDSPGDGEPAYAPSPGAAPLPEEPTPAQRDAERRRHSRNPARPADCGPPAPVADRDRLDRHDRGAILIVLAIKEWVVNPYRIPSSSMEPTLHCARPGQGCEARLSDRVLANRFIYHFREPEPRRDHRLQHAAKLAASRRATQAARSSSG